MHTAESTFSFGTVQTWLLYLSEMIETGGMRKCIHRFINGVKTNGPTI
jgi:hypothetical protein